MLVSVKTKTQLLVLYLFVCVTIALRVNTEATGYISPDSTFYLKTATNFIEGKGLITPEAYPFDDNTPQSYTAIWPVGYPFLIGAASFLTSLDVFTSSKLVNIIFLGLIFVLLYFWFGSNSILAACYFCSFGKLEVYSYTWSEGAFLFFLLWSLYLIEKIVSSKPSRSTVVLLILSLSFMVLLRYAGLIFIFYLAVIAVVLYFKKRHDALKQIIVVTAVSGLLAASFLVVNYQLSGGFFGNLPRIFPEQESMALFASLFFDGLMNELLLARNFYWVFDPLFVVLFVVQLLASFYISHNRKRLQLLSLNGLDNQITFYAGFFYLAFIVVLRKLSPFEDFDYRILAPFATPIFVSLLGNLKLNGSTVENKLIKVTIVGFFVVSLIMNLPKRAILEWVGL